MYLSGNRRDGGQYQLTTLITYSTSGIGIFSLVLFVVVGVVCSPLVSFVNIAEEAPSSPPEAREAASLAPSVEMGVDDEAAAALEAALAVVVVVEAPVETSSSSSSSSSDDSPVR